MKEESFRVETYLAKVKNFAPPGVKGSVVLMRVVAKTAERFLF